MLGLEPDTWATARLPERITILKTALVDDFGLMSMAMPFLQTVGTKIYDWLAGSEPKQTATVT